MAPTAEGLPERLIQAIVDYAHHAKAESTWKAYEADLRHFAAWCDAQGLSPLPAAPTTVAVYLADHAPPVNATSTLRRRLASISVYAPGRWVPASRPADSDRRGQGRLVRYPPPARCSSQQDQGGSHRGYQRAGGWAQLSPSTCETGRCS